MVKVSSILTMKRCSTKACAIASNEFFKFKYLSLDDIKNNNSTSCSVLYECSDVRLVAEQVYSYQDKGSNINLKTLNIACCHPMNSYSVVILGELSVGKSALCHSFFRTGISVLTPNENALNQCNDEIFDDAGDGTATHHHLFERPIIVNGTGSRIRILDVNTEKQFLESSGADGFGNLTSYLDAGDGYIVAYAVTDMGTFETARNVISRMSQSQMLKRGNFPIILVGNKCDLVRKRQVSTAEGIKLAERYNVKFVETSATLNQNVEELFHGIINQIRLKEEESKTKSLKATLSLQKESRNRLCQALCYPLNSFKFFRGKTSQYNSEIVKTDTILSLSLDENKKTEKNGLHDKCSRKVKKRKGVESVKKCQDLSVV